jgi:hypothetical protein
MKTLVIFSKDWADEFTVNAFQVFDLDMKATKKLLKAEVIGQPKYFGTNEGWEEGEIEMDDFTLKEISDEEAEVITKFLGKSFGTCDIY